MIPPKACLALPLLLVAAFAQQAPQPNQQGGVPQDPPKKARIEGTVVSSTGGPVVRAQVRVTSPASVVNGAISQGGQYAATTNETGGFAIENIDPGSGFQLTVQKAGFLTARYGQRTPNMNPTPFSLAPGQSLKDISVSMIPQGVVTGRILDARGDPVQGVQVTLLRRGYQRGVRQLVTSDSAQTNDLGEYRIANVSSGRYFIQATPRRTDLVAASSSGEETSPILTFFPNAIDAAGAAPVDVGAGQEVRGIDIRLRQGRVFSVAGHIVSPNGQIPQNMRVLIAPRSVGASSGAELVGDTILILNSGTSQQQVKADGTFQFRNLTAGSYTLQAAAPNNNNAARMMARFDFELGDKNLKDIAVPLVASSSIQGSLRLEGGEIKDILNPPSKASQTTASTAPTTAGTDPARNNVPRFAVTLNPVVQGPLSSSASGQVKPDGTFTIEGLVPGSYFLSTSGALGSTYVKLVRFGGTDVTTRAVEVTGSGGIIEIMLAKNPASVTGTVQNSKGEAQIGLRVALWPRDADTSSSSAGIRISTTNQTGGFQYGGLRPGVYYVAAFEDVDSGLLQARDYLALLNSDAQKVEVREGESPSVQLVPITEAKAKATEEKLP